MFLSFAIVAPFSLFKRLDALKWTSALSVVFVYFLTIIVIAHAIPGGDLDPCESIEVRVCVPMCVDVSAFKVVCRIVELRMTKHARDQSHWAR